MAIDITKPSSFKDLGIDELIEDAIERGDNKALDWLEEQSIAKKLRRKKNSEETYEVNMPISEIRANYLKDFLHYKPKSSTSKAKAKAEKDEKRRKEMLDKFASARARMNNK